MGRGSGSQQHASGVVVRDMLQVRRPVSDARQVPRWSSPPTFASYGAWLDARGTDAIEQWDYGFQWRNDRSERGRRMSWVPATGELILVGPRPDQGHEHDSPVEVLAHGLLDEAAVGKAIPRWAHAH